MAEGLIETLRRVYVPNEKGVYLEIGDYSENSDYLGLRANDERSRDWFGKFDISMSTHFARALGMALIASADDKEKSR